MAPSIRTSDVYVVFTQIDETLAAAHVARELAAALDVPLTLVHLRSVPYPLAVEARDGVDPTQTDEFVARLKAAGIETRVRVFLGRDQRASIPLAFRPHSLIVIGGRRSWPRTASERWRRQLEAAGHFVVFVDTSEHEELKRA